MAAELPTELPAITPANERLRREWLIDCEARQLTEKTLVNYGSSVRIWLQWLGDFDPLEADVLELKEFLSYLKKDRNVGEKSIMRYFSAIQSFYEYLEYEDRIERSPLPRFRRRYLKPVGKEARKRRTGLRQLLEVDQARQLVHSVFDPRDRAVLVLLLKTGIRREELIDIDVEDIDWNEMSITLKKRPKRTNLIVFFDDETSRVLRQWLRIRELRGAGPTGPLFLNSYGDRLQRNGVYYIVANAAEALGLHDPNGNLKQKFTPHACRHWFTTHLRRAGMTREHIAWLRGDASGETMDIYMHVDPKDVREAYRAFVPQLGL